MATLKKELKDLLDKYGIDPQDKSKLWDCHGTLVLYHKAYEIIAAKEDIRFDPPQIIEGNSKDKIVCVCVTGHMGDRKEWSFGEAAPGNCTNKYPYAMAEKRAKDRVIGKLAGLAQYVYSEDEAEDFKPSKHTPEDNDEHKETSREDKAFMRDFLYELGNTEDVPSLIEQMGDRFDSLSDEMNEQISGQLEIRRSQIKNNIQAIKPIFKFLDVQEAGEFSLLCGEKLEKLDAEELREWALENDHKIKAMDKSLSAEKYKKNGKTPSQRFLDAYNSKTHQHAAE